MQKVEKELAASLRLDKLLIILEMEELPRINHRVAHGSRMCLSTADTRDQPRERVQ